jgi:hypothetical protein
MMSQPSSDTVIYNGDDRVQVGRGASRQHFGDRYIGDGLGTGEPKGPRSSKDRASIYPQYSPVRLWWHWKYSMLSGRQ